MKLANSVAAFVLLLTAIGGILVLVHDLHQDLSDSHLLLVEMKSTMSVTSDTIKATGKTVGDAVNNIADATENMQHDVRDLANGVTASMDTVATDTARNLEIFGGTQNELRQIIRDPRFKQAVFDALANTNGVMQHAQLTLQTADGAISQSQKTLDAATGTFNQASTFFASTDPFVTNLGKISGDAYTVEHKYFFPPTQKMSVAGYLWKGFQIGKDIVLPGGEAAYYFTNARW
jgi:hypothetical protein